MNQNSSRLYSLAQNHGTGVSTYEHCFATSQLLRKGIIWVDHYQNHMQNQGFLFLFFSYYLLAKGLGWS
jgi:hypothetical protein